MNEPTASIWEIALLIVTDAHADPSEIAQAHGFSIAEVAEMLPLLGDNLRVEFARAGSSGADLPTPQPAPGESPELFVGRYLASIGGSDGVQVEPYTTLAAPATGNGRSSCPGDAARQLQILVDPRIREATRTFRPGAHRRPCAWGRSVRVGRSAVGRRTDRPTAP